MNEITKIHLGRQAFTVAVEAHKALETYLSAIKKEAGDTGKEVAKEVEMRMAELLVERGITGDKVVLLEDVQYLKSQLGLPKDFHEDPDEASDEHTASEEHAARRLFRDTKQAAIAGVAAGLAAYLNLPVWLIRIMFIALTLLWGWGILLYIVLWLLVPEATSSGNRLQMQGKAVNVQNLKSAVSRADVPGAAQRAGRTIRYSLGVVGKVVLAAMGIGFLLAGAALFVAAMITGFYSLFHGGNIFGDIVFPIGAREVWLVLCGMLALAATSLLFLLIGVAMVRRKWSLPGWAAAALIGVVLASASVGTALGLDAAPSIAKRIDALHQRSISSVAPFQKIDLKGQDTEFIFVPSDLYNIELRYVGRSSLQELVSVDVAGDTLAVDTSKLASKDTCRFICFNNDRKLEVIIRAPQVQEVQLGGSNSTFTNQGRWRQQDVTIVPHTGNLVQLNHVYPQELVVADDPAHGQLEIRLHGLRPNTSEIDSLFYSDQYNDLLDITRTDKLQLNIVGECHHYQSFVQLTYMPAEIVVNGAPAITSLAQFRSQQQPEDITALNCVYVSQR